MQVYITDSKFISYVDMCNQPLGPTQYQAEMPGRLYRNAPNISNPIT